MRDSKFLLGVVLTITWLALGAWIVIATPDARPTKMNEWGDVFAGFFSPVAFLWLVLGFMQQGDELRLNTKALELQAEELRNSVNQQRELVEVTRRQVDAELEALRAAREDKRQAAQPKFIVSDPGAFWSATVRYTSNIKNVGSTATDVLFTFDPPLKLSTLTRLGSIARGESQSFEFEYTTGVANDLTIMRIDYTDADGGPGTQRFRLKAVQSNPGPMVEITKDHV